MYSDSLLFVAIRFKSSVMFNGVNLQRRTVGICDLYSYQDKSSIFKILEIIYHTALRQRQNVKKFVNQNSVIIQSYELSQ